MATRPVIKVTNLKKMYGDFAALKGVSFEVAEGQILGLLGPNGAGKSTAMKILTSYISASDGQVEIDGIDLFSDPIETRRRIGYLPETTPLYLDMLVYDYLMYAGEMRGISRSECDKKILDLAKRIGFVEKIGMPIGTLSKGYRQRIGLAQALLHNPKILILDEPTSGLDPNQIVEIRKLIRELGKDHTVILSTHILPEVRATCDRIVIIHHGEVVADGSIEELDGRITDTHALRVSVADSDGNDQETVRLALAALDGVLDVRVTGFGADPKPHHDFEVHSNSDIRAALFEWASAGGHTLLELGRKGMDLESIFQRLTQEG